MKENIASRIFAFALAAVGGAAACAVFMFMLGIVGLSEGQTDDCSRMAGAVIRWAAGLVK